MSKVNNCMARGRILLAQDTFPLFFFYWFLVFLWFFSCHTPLSHHSLTKPRDHDRTLLHWIRGRISIFVFRASDQASIFFFASIACIFLFSTPVFELFAYDDTYW